MRPQDPSGFSGATNSMVLREENGKYKNDFPIDWSVWGGGEFLMKREEENNNDNNNIINNEEEISGPWMDRWRKPL